MRDYNFFSAFDKKKGLDINPKSPYFIALIIVIVAVLATAGLNVRNMILNNELGDLQLAVENIRASAEYQEALALQSEMETLSEYEKGADIVLADFERQNALGTTVLNQLTASLPATSSIITMNMNHATFTATLNVPDRRTGAELILRLEESGLFQMVHASSLTQAQGQTGFVMAIECERKVADFK